MTRSNREALAETSVTTNISIRETMLRRQPKEVWFSIQETLKTANLAGRSVMLDISTMPREVIWWSLKFLQRENCAVSFVYHRPGGYSQEWLTRDTGEPRLVYQCSGIARLGQPTGLLLLSGFDLDRAQRMIQYFEPSLVLLGIQGGNQFENISKNIDPARALTDRMTLAKPFDVNAFGEDMGFQAMLDAIHPNLASHNFIAASLGPKVSAISLFRLHSTYPEIALTYAPSRQFNSEYSTGIGDAITGDVPLCAEARDSLGFVADPS